ncbi:MAG: DUF5011 domain-containing protein [Chloroflexi bacterium]|nr:DUF5011 domain-containing protein [Chloroflexota bacterium]
MSKFISLKEATKYCAYDQEYLSLRARQGKLQAKKVNGKWVTTKEYVLYYVQYIEEYKTYKKTKVWLKPSKPVLFSLPKKEYNPLSFKLITSFVLVLLLIFTGAFGKDGFIPTLIRTIDTTTEEVGNKVAALNYQDVFQATVSSPQTLANGFDYALKNPATVAETTKGYVNWLKDTAVDLPEDIVGSYIKLDSFVEQGLQEDSELITAFFGSLKNEVQKSGRSLTQFSGKVFNSFSNQIGLLFKKEEIVEVIEQPVVEKEVVEVVKEVERIVRVQEVKEIVTEIRTVDSAALSNIQAQLSTVLAWKTDIDNLKLLTAKLQATPPTATQTAAAVYPVYVGSVGLQVGGNANFDSLGVSGSAGIRDLGVGRSATFGNNSSDDFTVNSTATFASNVTVSAATTLLSLTITDALTIPAGTTVERPDGSTGSLRYNTTLSTFEGYNGSNWTGLGGVIDVDQDTYIKAELTSGSDDDTLFFYTAGTERLRIDSSGVAIFKHAPTAAHTATWAIGSLTWNQDDASIYINPASATGDSNLLALAVAGGVKFAVDAEGDVYANNLILTGTSTIAGDLTVEGNTILGDTNTDTVIFTADIASSITFDPGATRTITIRTDDTAGDQLNITGGSGGTGAVTGGVLALTGGAAGSGTTGGVGGNITLTAGAADGTGDNAGGDIVLLGGTATGSGNIGVVRVGSPTITSTRATNLLAIGGGLEVDGATRLDGTLASGALTVTGSGSVTTSFTAASLLATTNDSGAIGASGTGFSDLFLASGAVIDFAASSQKLTHVDGGANPDYLLLQDADGVSGALVLAGTVFAIDTFGVTAQYLSFLSPINGAGGIVFADSEGSHQGGIRYGHVSDNLIFRTGGADQIDLVASTFAPSTSDAIALGSATKMFSDLFLASGAVINFNAGDVTLTHGVGGLTVGGTIGTDWADLGSVTTVDINGGTIGGVTLDVASIVTADLTFNDNVKATFGTGGDADLYYNGTDLILNPKVVGAGQLIVGTSTVPQYGNSVMEISAGTNSAISFGPSTVSEPFILTAVGSSGNDVISGSSLWGMYFRGWHTAAYGEAAAINVEVDGTPSATTDMPGRIVFKTSPDGTASPVEALRIDSSQDTLLPATKKLVLDGTDKNAYLYEKSDGIVSMFTAGLEQSTWGSSYFAVNNNLIIFPTKKLYFDSGADTYIYEESDDDLHIVVGNDAVMQFDQDIQPNGGGISMFPSASPSATVAININKALGDRAQASYTGISFDLGGHEAIGANAGTFKGMYLNLDNESSNTQDWTATVSHRLYDGQIRMLSSTAETITGIANFYATSPVISGTVDNYYAFYAETETGAGSNYFLYNAGTMDNVIGSGNTYINDVGGLVIGHTAQLTINALVPETQIIGTVDGADSALAIAGHGTGIEPSLVFAKARGTVASPLAAQNGDNMGEILWVGHDGTDFTNTNMARIHVISDGGAVFDSNTTGAMIFSTSPAGSGTVTEAMRIDSGGRVLVGYTSQRSVGGEGNPLQIHGSITSDITGAISILNYDLTSNVGAKLKLVRSDTDTVGSQGLVDSGDQLGAIEWFGSDGGDFVNMGGKIDVVATGTPAVNDMESYMAFYTNAGGTGVTEALRIDSSQMATFADRIHITNTGMGVRFGAAANKWGLSYATQTANFLSIGDTGTYDGIEFFPGGISDIRFLSNGDVILEDTSKLFFDGGASGGNTYIVESSADTVDFYSGGEMYMRAGLTDVVFSETGSQDRNFRVESVNIAHMLSMDAGSNTLGIGWTGNAGSVLNITGGTTGRDYLSSQGVVVNIVNDTINDTGTADTTAILAMVDFGTQTLTATNAQTYTDAATLYIAGAPVDGDAQVTIGTAYALWVDDGLSRFDGDIRMGSESYMWIGPDSTATGFVDANVTVGLVINQEANDNSILALKSSDVAHGLTSMGLHAVETDTWLAIRKRAPTGGAAISVYDATGSANSRVLHFVAAGGDADTTTTALSTSLTQFVVMDHDGANARVSLGDTDNAFGIQTHSGGGFKVQFLVKGNGNIHMGNELILGLGDAETGGHTGKTLRAPNHPGGTDTNSAGADLTISAGQGTGTGDVGQLIFQTPRVGTTGTTVHTVTTLLTLDESTVKIANSGWLAGIDNAGTGVVNMFKVNTSDEIEVGAALSLGGGLTAAEDSGAITIFDMPVSATPTAGTEMSATFKIDSDNILTIYAEADNSGGIQNKSVAVPNGAFCVDNDDTGCPSSPTAGRLYSISATVLTDDLAEYMRSYEELQPGDIVVVDPDFENETEPTYEQKRRSQQLGTAKGLDEIGVKQSTEEYESTIIGVVSTKPGIILGGFDPTQDDYEIALTGRVPVKVSIENGPIVVGDRITSSLIPGVGMKADAGGQTIGVALEEYDGTQENNNILLFLNISYQGNDLSVTEEGGELLSIDPEQLRIGLASLGLVVNTNGILEVNTLVAQRLELIDQRTGDTYCTWLEYGDWVKVQGECSTIEISGGGGGGSDTTSPVITLTGASTVELILDDAYIDSGATATDDIDGDITASITIVSNVDTTTLGNYTVTYDVVDAAGNTATSVVRVVNVVETLSEDTTPPVITLLGDTPIELTVDDTYIEEGATALDDVDGDITADIITVSDVDTSIVGSYTVTYNVSDAATNTAEEVTRTVNVTEPVIEDTTPPVITLLGTSPVELVVDDIYTDEGATALDDTDGDITATIVTVSTVDTSVVGDYTVTYNVTDVAGNVAVEVVRTVNVLLE